MTKYTYSYDVFGQPGTMTVRTGVKEDTVPTLIKTQIVRYISLAGIKVLRDDIKNLTHITTDSVKAPETPAMEPTEGNYYLVSFRSSGKPGPYHMLAGENPAGGCICGTNRNPETIVLSKTIAPGEKWPEHKYCAKCHKAWSARERNRKAEEKAVRKAIRSARKGVAA